MKVFLFNQKLISVINRKEEITDETCLITDQEEQHITETLNGGGYFWRIDKYTVGVSGKKPSELHKWNDNTHKWEIDSDLVEQKRQEDLTIRLKQLQLELQEQNYKDIAINGNVYPCDIVARTSYTECSNMLMLGMYLEDRKINTKQGEFVLTSDLLKQIIGAMYKRGNKLNEIMRKATEEIKKSEKPLNYNVVWEI